MSEPAKGSPEWLRDQIATLKNEREGVLARVNAIGGAIQAYEHLLAPEPAPEPEAAPAPIVDDAAA